MTSRMAVSGGPVQIARYLQRRDWGVVGISLVLAALVTLLAANIHINGLPTRPSTCNPIDCSDPIYDLRTPYGWLAAGAVPVGLVGFIVLSRARPLRWANSSPPSSGWASWPSRLALSGGLVFGLWLPWLLFISGPNATVPKFALLIFLGSVVVHLALWWWLRRQTGIDRGAWTAALTMQVLVTMLMAPLAIALPLPTSWLVPLIHVACFFIGVAIATPALKNDDDGSQAVEETATVRQRHSAMPLVAVGAIALATAWASWPQSVPEELQARLDADRLHIRESDRELSTLPGQPADDPVPPHPTEPQHS